MKIKKINYSTEEFVITQYLIFIIVKKLGFNQRKDFFNNIKNQLILIIKENKVIKQYFKYFNSYLTKIKIYKKILQLSYRGQQLKINIKIMQKLYKYGVF